MLGLSSEAVEGRDKDCHSLVITSGSRLSRQGTQSNLPVLLGELLPGYKQKLKPLLRRSFVTQWPKFLTLGRKPRLMRRCSHCQKTATCAAQKNEEFVKTPTPFCARKTGPESGTRLTPALKLGRETGPFLAPTAVQLYTPCLALDRLHRYVAFGQDTSAQTLSLAEAGDPLTASALPQW